MKKIKRRRVNGVGILLFEIFDGEFFSFKNGKGIYKMLNVNSRAPQYCDKRGKKYKTVQRRAPVVRRNKMR